MTTMAYIIALAVYLSAAAAMSVIFWKLSESWRQDLKKILRVSLVVILFTPYFSDPAQYKLAPAFLISFFELVFGDPEIALRASIPLIVLLLLCNTSSFIVHLTRRKTQ